MSWYVNLVQEEGCSRQSLRQRWHHTPLKCPFLLKVVIPDLHLGPLSARRSDWSLTIWSEPWYTTRLPPLPQPVHPAPQNQRVWPLTALAIPLPGSDGKKF